MNPETYSSRSDSLEPRDRRRSLKNADTMSDVRAWRDAAAEDPRHTDDEKGCRSNVAIIDALGDFLDRLEANSARFQVRSHHSAERGVTVSIILPETQGEQRQRADAVAEMFQKWRAEDEREEETPLGEIKRVNFRRVPEVGAES